jgi:hypothetical protein
MTQVTHNYCGHCQRYIGTENIPQCPYCGTIFNIYEHMGTITRTQTKTTVNIKPLTYTVAITVGIGSFICVSALTISWISKEWADFFASLLTSLKWQLALTGVFFSVLFSLLKGLFWEKIEILTRGYWQVHRLLQAVKRLLAPLVSHRRMAIIFCLIAASILAMPLLAWQFNRVLDGYDIGFNLMTNILGGLFVVLVEDVISQREQIQREKNWKPPATITEWERAPQTQK